MGLNNPQENKPSSSSGANVAEQLIELAEGKLEEASEVMQQKSKELFQSYKEVWQQIRAKNIDLPVEEFLKMYKEHLKEEAKKEKIELPLDSAFLVVEAIFRKEFSPHLSRHSQLQLKTEISV